MGVVKQEGRDVPGKIESKGGSERVMGDKERNLLVF